MKRSAHSTPLPGMTVPPMLEAALGCFSSKRYLLFFKRQDNDVAWTDGCIAANVYWPTWLLYSNSPSVSRFLRHHSMQVLDPHMSHGLVLDRNKRRFSIDDPQCIHTRLMIPLAGLSELPIEPRPHIELAVEMTQHIANYMYK